MPASSQTARLKTLRRRVFLLFMIVTALLLGAFGWLILRTDQQAQIQQVDAELDRRATAARSLLYYDEADEILQIDGLLDDEAMEGRPQVYAVGLEEGLVFGPAVPDFDLDIDDFVQRATSTDSSLFESLADADGHPVRVAVRVFYHDTTDEIAGAVVVAGEGQVGPTSRLRAIVFSGVATLLALLGVALWLVINQTIRPAETALAQQERFVANAAHELRRPLTALRANAETAVANARGGERQSSPGMAAAQPALERSIGLVDEAATMVDNLLVLAELDASQDTAELRPLRLDQLVEVVIDDAIEARQDLDHSSVQLVAADSVVVQANEPLLRQAIRNLVDNALTHGAAPVEVRVRQSELVVGDSGSGFENGAVERAFQRFDSGDSSRGAGLGLAIVASVVRAHDATLYVRRSPLGGAEFAIEFD